MSIRNLAAILPLVAFTACGSSDTTDTTFAITEGTYAVSSARIGTSDGCGLIAAYTDPGKVVGIRVAGNAATLNPPNDLALWTQTLAKATINGTALDFLSASSYPAGPFGTDCLLTNVNRFTGEILGNDHVSLNFSYTLTYLSGTCDIASGSPVVGTGSCSSNYLFEATRTGPIPAP